MSKFGFSRCESEEDLRRCQTQGLRWTVSHAFANSHFYRQRMQDAHINPDDIRSMADLQRLPFTSADDLQAGYPFPFLSAPFEQVVRIHTSSGTTGRRKILCYTKRDIDDWADMFARCYETAGLTREDRVQIAVGYGLWTAGVGFQLGCERFGAMAVPVGPGNLDIHFEMLVDLQSTVLGCTASMGLLMAEEVGRRGLRDRLALRKVIFGAERHSDAMRKRMEEGLGVEESFDIPGLTELYGPGTGLECQHHQGIHYWADYYILEIIEPSTLEPVPEGEVGEMVVTTLRKEAAPLIRYRTRDLTRLIPGRCPCGSIMPRHDRLLGRSDDMFIVRGVNVYPGQIDEYLSKEQGAGSEYQVILERREDARDTMKLRLERGPGADPSGDASLAARIEVVLRKHLLVRCAVQIVDYQSLPRTERKSRRVFDNR
jgi:phenylacetate-CoA ligase